MLVGQYFATVSVATWATVASQSSIRDIASSNDEEAFKIALEHPRVMVAVVKECEVGKMKVQSVTRNWKRETVRWKESLIIERRRLGRTVRKEGKAVAIFALGGEGKLIEGGATCITYGGHGAASGSKHRFTLCSLSVTQQLATDLR